MKRLLLIVTLIAAFSALATGQAPVADHPPVTDPVAKLRDLAGNESALVEAARAFDKQETGLAARDLEQSLAEARTGNAADAKKRQERARQRYQSVREAYEFVLKKYHNNARAQTYYGELLYDHFGDHAAAVQAWELAVALDPKFSVPFNDLAIHYCHEGQYKKGLECYDKALALEPRNPDYLFNLAQMYLVNAPEVQKIRGWNKQKVFHEAMKISKRAAELAPKDFQIVQDYAMNFFAAENFGVKVDWKKSARVWQQARKLAGNPDRVFYTWMYEARAWIRDGNKTKAEACLKQAIDLRPNDKVAKNLLARTQEKKPAQKNDASNKKDSGKKTNGK